jgi:CMP-N,N'-diacetyllegionaminic acid synthase
MSVLAIVPARIGSKGILRKNFRNLAGETPIKRAVDVAFRVGADIVVSSDGPNKLLAGEIEVPLYGVTWLHAPAPLHTDECAMIDVVKDVLARVPGPEDQIIVLLQPTQPLREPKHVQAAIALLEESKADSVVSVVAVGLRDEILYMDSLGELDLLMMFHADWRDSSLQFPARRQEQDLAYKRDGTVYAFRRATVTEYGNIYGKNSVPLIMDPSETCSLDSEADWVDAERRLREREG